MVAANRLSFLLSIVQAMRYGDWQCRVRRVTYRYSIVPDKHFENTSPTGSHLSDLRPYFPRHRIRSYSRSSIKFALAICRASVASTSSSAQPPILGGCLSSRILMAPRFACSVAHTNRPRPLQHHLPWMRPVSRKPTHRSRSTSPRSQVRP